MASEKSSHCPLRGHDGSPQALTDPQQIYRPEDVRILNRKPIRHSQRTVASEFVRIFSRSANAWVDGKAAEVLDDNFVRVEYNVGRLQCRKKFAMALP